MAHAYRTTAAEMPRGAETAWVPPLVFPGPPAGVESAGEVCECQSLGGDPQLLAGDEHPGVEGVEALDPLHHRARRRRRRGGLGGDVVEGVAGADQDDPGRLGGAGAPRWRPSRCPRRCRAAARASACRGTPPAGRAGSAAPTAAMGAGLLLIIWSIVMVLIGTSWGSGGQACRSASEQCLTAATDSASSGPRSIRLSIEHVCDVRAGVRTESSGAPNECSNRPQVLRGFDDARCARSQPPESAGASRSRALPLGRHQADAALGDRRRDGRPRTTAPRQRGMLRTTRRAPTRSTASWATSSTARIRPPECTSRVASESGGLAVEHRGLHAVGAHRVHPHRRRRLGVDRHRQRDDRGLGGGVHAQVRHRPQPRQRGGVDDVAAVLAERLDRGAHPPDRAEQVDLDLAPDRLLRHVGEQCRRGRRRRC